MWTYGLLRDLDITVGQASALFKKTSNCQDIVCETETGIWLSLSLGGLANLNIMDDIQAKILDKFDVGPLKAVVGLLGKGIEAMVNALTSIGMKFDLYSKNVVRTDVQTHPHQVLEGCDTAALGIKFTASAFEAYLEHGMDGKVAFCFAIKSIFNSCG